MPDFVQGIVDLITNFGPALAAFAVPFAVAAVKKVTPALKAKASWAIPVIAMLLPVIGDAILAGLGAINGLGPIPAALLGVAGIGIREIFDQLRKVFAPAV